jgi:hypothetical protein
VSVWLSRRQIAGLVVVAGVVGLLVAFGLPADAAAGQLQQIGKNARQEVTGTVGQLFLAGLACIAVFLWWKRLYGELMVTCLAAAVVAWVVFSSEGVANVLRGVAKDFFG